MKKQFLSLLTLVSMMLVCATSANAQTAVKVAIGSYDNSSCPAETVLDDNECFIATTVFASEAKSGSYTYKDGTKFSNWIQIRVTDEPSASNPNGTAHVDSKTSSPSTSVVIVAKKNATLSAYVRTGNNKTCNLYDQSTYTKVEGTSEYIPDGEEDASNYFWTWTWTIEAGKTYVLTEKGGTGRLSGFSYILSNSDYTLNIAEPHLYSLYLDYPATIPAGVTAYTGTLNTEETLLTLNEVEGGVIPANTAVVVEATTTGEYTFEKADEDVAEIANNSLKGVTEATLVTDLETAEGKTVLTLGILNNVIGFRKPAGESILANRVYLPVTTPETGEAKSISISFGGETTGISEVNAQKAEANAPVYNLAGQRVAADTKGLLIKNGKKYIRK